MPYTRWSFNDRNRAETLIQIISIDLNSMVNWLLVSNNFQLHKKATLRQGATELCDLLLTKILHCELEFIHPRLLPEQNIRRCCPLHAAAELGCLFISGYERRMRRQNSDQFETSPQTQSLTKYHLSDPDQSR
eukprot:scpid49781/ scgid8728/ 